MAWTSYFVRKTDDFNGCVSTYDQFKDLKRVYEDATQTYFIDGRTTKDFNKDIGDESVKSARFFFEDPQSSTTKGPQLLFTGHPTAVLGTMQLHCRFGPNRHQKRIDREQQEKNQALGADHPHTTGKQTRKLVQDTMKKGCKAEIRLREILVLTDITIQDSSSKNTTKGILQRKKYLQETKHPVTERMILVKLPNMSDHNVKHLMGENATLVAPIHDKVMAQLHRFTQDGVSSTTEMKRHLETYVEKQLCVNWTDPPLRTNRRYYPTNVDISNHMRMFRTRSRVSNDDQENVRLLVEKWKTERKEESFFYRKNQIASASHDAETFLFVHQTPFQKKLITKYGNQLSLMDATYKTSKYALPLFQLCVSTNVGYSVVATFVVESESIPHIQEALSIIQQWNKDWSPEYFLVDFDTKEIGAIANIFPNCVILLCKFHREKSWNKWLSCISNGMLGKKDQALKYLRAIANAATVSEYKEAVAAIQESDLFKHDLFNRYITKTWLEHHKKWVEAFRNGRITNFINTTNGVESKHKVLKYSYLVNYSDNTIPGLVTTIVTRFIPDNENRYRSSNVKSSNLYKEYSHNLPQFLHHKPKPFVEHCLSKLPPHKLIDSIKCIKQDEYYEVQGEEDRMYNVDLTIPNCSCPAWRKKHLPCKHMLAVLDRTNGKWNCLPENYRTAPVFQLDIVETVTHNQFETSAADLHVPSVDVKAPAELRTAQVETLRTAQVETQAGLCTPSDATAVDTAARLRAPAGDQVFADPPLSANANSLRAKSIRDLSIIQNLSFLTTDVRVLGRIQSTLSACIEETIPAIPTYNGLYREPHANSLRRSRKRKLLRHPGGKRKMAKLISMKRPTKSQKRENTTSQPSLLPEENPVEENQIIIDAASCASAMDHHVSIFGGVQIGDQSKPRIKNELSNCWFNSTIQALKVIVQGDKLQSVLRELAEGDPYSRILSFLVELQNQQQPTSYDPQNVLLDVRTLSDENLQLGIQQDVHEFLCLILGKLVESNLIFPVELTTKMRCCNGHIHPTLTQHIQSTSHISLAIDTENALIHSIQECLKQTIEDENVWPVLLCGEESVLCGLCCTKRSTYQKTVLTNSSDDLIIHLKRFRNNNSKINRRVQINRNLVLPCANYSLSAVQCHHGEAIDEGHYYTVCIEDNVAYNYDDNMVFRHDDVENYLSEHVVEKQCYILYYKKVETYNLRCNPTQNKKIGNFVARTTETDQNKNHCYCRKTLKNRFMVSCDTCKKEYHGSCVGVDETIIDKKWNCITCSTTNRKPAVKRKGGNQTETRQKKVMTPITKKIPMPLDLRVLCKGCNKPGENSSLNRCDVCRDCFHFRCTVEKTRCESEWKCASCNRDNNFKCPICAKMVKGLRGKAVVRKHMLEHYYCLFCFKSCKSEEGLQHHVLSTHKIQWKRPTEHEAKEYANSYRYETEILNSHIDLRDDPDFQGELEGHLHDNHVYGEDPVLCSLFNSFGDTPIKRRSGWGDFYVLTEEQMVLFENKKKFFLDQNIFPTLISPAFIFYLLNVGDLNFQMENRNVVLMSTAVNVEYFEWFNNFSDFDQIDVENIVNLKSMM